jgi:hypothetical protein
MRRGHCAAVLSAARLHDAAHHGADVGAAVAPDLSLVPDATEADALEGPPAQRLYMCRTFPLTCRALLMELRLPVHTVYFHVPCNLFLLMCPALQ